MKRTRHTPEQVIRKLREADALLASGASIGEVCRSFGVSETTYYRWRQQFGGMTASDSRRLRELEKENARLKRLVAAGAGEPGAAGGRRGKLLSPTRRRAAVRHVQRRFGLSERRACRILEQPRSSQRYHAREPRRNASLVKRMRSLAKKHPRYGFRRIHALLVRSGWRVNRKRVQRLWRAEGLKVPRRQRKRRRLGSREQGCLRHRAEYTNHVWSYDFTLDQTVDGKRLKFMPVVDEFTRECHTIEVERSITAEDVIATLTYLFQVHGEPEYLRSDNGPEFIARALQEWLAASGVKTLYIEPGSPWENAYLESFNGKLEDELLGRELFTSLLEAKVIIEAYRVEYNHERPHSALGYQTPVEFAASCRTPEVAAKEVDAPPHPSSPHAAAGSCTEVLSSQRMENSTTPGLP